MTAHAKTLALAEVDLNLRPSQDRVRQWRAVIQKNPDACYDSLSRQSLVSATENDILDLDSFCHVSRTWSMPVGKARSMIITLSE